MDSAALVLAMLLAAQSEAAPATVATRAHVSAGGEAATLSSAAATIEPRLGAPGYRWLRVYFWKGPAGTAPAGYRKWDAVLQLGIDKDATAWQVDLAVPGHTCTIAGSDREAKAMLQEYRFDGTHLRLKAKGSHSCEQFSWDIDLSIPVIAPKGR
jgi:hypothetical protein